MKSISLLISFALSFWVFRRDAKANPYPTWTLWVPTLWMMRCGSRSIDYWIGAGEAGRWDPVLLAAIIASGLFVLSKRRAQWGLIMAKNSALFLFYAYLVASVTWADAVLSPFSKVIRPIGDLVLALVVVTEPNPQQAIMTMFRRTAILLIPLSIALAKFFGELGRMTNKGGGADFWIGVATHKNPLGQLCMIAAMGYLWQLVEAKRRGEFLFRPSIAWLYLAMTAWLMFFGPNGTRSSTSIFCLMLAIGFFLVFGLMRERIPLLIRSIVGGILALLVVSLLLDFFGTSLQAVVAGMNGKDPTLTDRTYLWRDVIRIGMKSPIFGSGYGGFWTQELYDSLSPEVNNAPAEAHNGYLETFANLGILGLGFLAFVIIQVLINSAKMIKEDFEYGRLRLVLFFTILVMNWSEATFPRGTHLWWYGFLVIALYARPWTFWPEDYYDEEAEPTSEEDDAAFEQETPA